MSGVSNWINRRVGNRHRRTTIGSSHRDVVQVCDHGQLVGREVRVTRVERRRSNLRHHPSLSLQEPDGVNECGDRDGTQRRSVVTVISRGGRARKRCPVTAIVRATAAVHGSTT